MTFDINQSKAYIDPEDTSLHPYSQHPFPNNRKVKEGL
jgi:hypothetical protein